VVAGEGEDVGAGAVSSGQMRYQPTLIRYRGGATRFVTAHVQSTSVSAEPEGSAGLSYLPSQYYPPAAARRSPEARTEARRHVGGDPGSGEAPFRLWRARRTMKGDRQVLRVENEVLVGREDGHPLSGADSTDQEICR